MNSVNEYYCQSCRCTFFDSRTRTKTICPVCETNRRVELKKEW